MWGSEARTFRVSTPRNGPDTPSCAGGPRGVLPLPCKPKDLEWVGSGVVKGTQHALKYDG